MKRVYFIKPVGLDGPIKIGCSAAPEGRRGTLATWSPFALEIVAEISGGFDLERRFHALFAETHQRREWFGWSKRLAATIEAINSGTFDLASLPAPMSLASNRFRSPEVVARMKATWTPERRLHAKFDARRRTLLRILPKEEVPFLGYMYRLSEEEKHTEMLSKCEALNALTAVHMPNLPALVVPSPTQAAA